MPPSYGKLGIRMECCYENIPTKCSESASGNSFKKFIQQTHATNSQNKIDKIHILANVFTTPYMKHSYGTEIRRKNSAINCIAVTATNSWNFEFSFFDFQK